MSQSDVFRPANGDLYVRDPVANGVPVSANAYRKTSLPRPATHSGYRFGQMSHNSFFTRHNPHPNRVRHLKGLLDIPICSVNDDGYFASPRYSLQFPPNSYNINKLSNSVRGRIPVNAINVNSQLYPINTITGLQYFTGLNSFPFREKAIPKVGMVPTTEAWRDELKEFTEQLNVPEERKRDPEEAENHPILRGDRASHPTPLTHDVPGGVKEGQAAVFPTMQHIAAEPDMENVVLTMLCQILQTEDVNAVQSWLVSAGDREKTMVMDMIRTVMAGREEYSHQPPAQAVTDRPVLPPINDKQIIGDCKDDSMIDRLTLVDEPVIPRGPTMPMAVTMDPVETMPGIPAVPPPQAEPAMPVPAPSPPHIPMKPASPKAVIEDEDVLIKPPTNEVFKQSSFRPPTQGGRISRGVDVRPPGTADARLKYTKSPFVNGAVPDNMWNQQQSINNNTF
ncbi:protein TBATA-like [Haliotis rubra]|uniref:protein TBATA-like n=1 Tax=Haliotis rubra TaxID=36100 RepID=UPI001EE5D429|nr:protein TBATA-like [Haliotis rubra]